MTLEQLDLALLVGAGVLLIAVSAVRLSTRTGLPSLLLYLGLGLVIGSAGLEFQNAELTRTLGYVALVVILAEGGITTPWDQVRPVVAPAAVLGTVGVLVSVAVTALAAKAVLHADWRFAFLVAAIVSSTDAAAVFSVLRRVPLPRRLAGLLEAESGVNDAPAVILVVALSTWHSLNGWHVVGLMALELLGGAAVGLGIGFGSAWLLRRQALPVAGLYPVAVLAFTVLAYAAAAVMHLSGFIAVYLAGVVLGNSRLPHRQAVRGFVDGLAWLAQIGLFVMLGLLANAEQLGTEVLPAIAIGLALLLVARPLSVLLCLTPFRIPWREQAFLSWSGLRGAVPIVLATIPVTEAVRGSQRLFNLVFVLVVIFTLVQAPTLPRVARMLRLTRGDEAQEMPLEIAPLGRLDADVLQIAVPPWSQLIGIEVFELRLPRGANLALVVRAGEAFVPSGGTRLRPGDDLIVVVPSQLRGSVVRRLRAVSRGGRLAGWYGDHGEPAE